MHIVLQIQKAGEAIQENHFFVIEEGEIAEYTRNAIKRLYEDNPAVSLLDPDITLKFAKGDVPGA